VADARARAAYLGYRAAAEVARVLPPALARPLARSTGRAWRLTQPNRRHQVARNLERILPDASPDERHEALQRVFDYYSRYWHELFRLAVEDPAELVADFTVAGMEHLEAASAQGRGVVLALPHLGNWDLAGAWLSGQGYEITVVAEPAEPPELFEWFVETRARLGLRVVPLGPEAGGVLLRELRDNRVVCLLCDRDLTGDGIAVTFFGEKTRIPGGPAMLALRTGAPLLPVGLSFRPHDGHSARILAPVPADRHGRVRDDVTRVTQQLAERFEDLIRATPDQWLMLQPNWPSDVVTHP
jgi:lauroyl/myristoyl acyltransferase